MGFDVGTANGAFFAARMIQCFHKNVWRHCRLGKFRIGWGVGFSLGALICSLQASDWPGYRGPAHNGVSTDPILTSFPLEGPTEVWRVSLEPGFSSFAVSGGRAFTEVRRSLQGQDSEVCIALSTSDGSELWATPVDKASYPNGGAGTDDGPRSTPSVDGGAVYVLSSWLKLAKLDATNGAVIWQKDLVTLYGAQVIDWQNAASPVIDGDLIYLNCNSASSCLMALRKTDGAVAWRSGTNRLTHATPVPATILGVRQVIFFTRFGLVSVAANTGAELWRYAFPYSTSTAASPVVFNDIVYCSAAYGIGAAAVRISQSGTGFIATQLWRNTSLVTAWSTAVASQGYLYGLFGIGGNISSPLRCIDLATGNQMWSQPGFGQGGLLLVDGKLLANDEAGGVALVDSYPRSYTELARFQGATGKSWNSAAIANGRLYTRSTSEAACFDIAAPVPPADFVQTLQLLSGGNLRLRIGSADGSPISADRLPGFEVRFTTNLLNPLDEWAAVTNPAVLVDGVVELDLPVVSQECYFISTEQR